MPDLMNLNAFGLIQVLPHKIVVSVTAATTDGKSINREYTEDCDMGDLAEDDSEVIIFGAYVQAGHKAKVVVKDISNGHYTPRNNADVSRSLRNALDLLTPAMA